MTHTEPWTAVVELPRVEKLRLLQRLANDLAPDEVAATIQPNMPLEFWSPYDAHGAAAALDAALEADRLAKP